jgi:hypothetical protein
MAIPRKKARSDLRIENALLVTKTTKLENGRRCRFSASSEHPPPQRLSRGEHAANFPA